MLKFGSKRVHGSWISIILPLDSLAELLELCRNSSRNLDFVLFPTIQILRVGWEPNCYRGVMNRVSVGLMWLECHCLGGLQRWLQKYYLIAVALEAHMDIDTTDLWLGQLLWREKPKGLLIKIMVLVINVELRNIIRNPDNKCTYKGNIILYLYVIVQFYYV